MFFFLSGVFIIKQKNPFVKGLRHFFFVLFKFSFVGACAIRLSDNYHRIEHRKTICNECKTDIALPLKRTSHNERLSIPVSCMYRKKGRSLESRSVSVSGAQRYPVLTHANRNTQAGTPWQRLS